MSDLPAPHWKQWIPILSIESGVRLSFFIIASVESCILGRSCLAFVPGRVASVVVICVGLLRGNDLSLFGVLLDAGLGGLANLCRGVSWLMSGLG